jgi:hypothetical protein
LDLAWRSEVVRQREGNLYLSTSETSINAPNQISREPGVLAHGKNRRPIALSQLGRGSPAGSSYRVAPGDVHKAQSREAQD